jgi:hypothetical protein
MIAYKTGLSVDIFSQEADIFLSYKGQRTGCRSFVDR